MKRREKWFKVREMMDDAGFVMNDFFPAIPAVWVSRRWEGDPLWLLAVAAPGSGKTFSLQQFQKLRDTVMVGGVTPSSLISGFRGANDVDRSLFKKVENDKLLVAKDFGTVLSMNSNQIAEVMSLLREAFDGYVNKNFGNLGTVEYHPHFNMIAASTEAAESHSQFRQQLGERFLRFQVEPVDIPSPPPVVDESVKGKLNEWACQIEQVGQPNMNAEEYRWISRVAEATAILRTEVIRDSRTKSILEVPHFEGPVRLEKEMLKFYKGLKLVTGDVDYSEKLVRHAARSSIKPRKVKVIKAIMDDEAERPATMPLARLFRHGPGQQTIRRLLNDMYALGIMDREQGAQYGEYVYEINDDFERYFQTLFET